MIHFVLSENASSHFRHPVSLLGEFQKTYLGQPAESDAKERAEQRGSHSAGLWQTPAPQARIRAELKKRIDLKGPR
jgi:hypothetical protein